MCMCLQTLFGLSLVSLFGKEEKRCALATYDVSWTMDTGFCAIGTSKMEIRVQKAYCDPCLGNIDIPCVSPSPFPFPLVIHRKEKRELELHFLLAASMMLSSKISWKGFPLSLPRPTRLSESLSLTFCEDSKNIRVFLMCVKNRVSKVNEVSATAPTD